MTTEEGVDPNKTARIAGLLYLMMAPLGIFGLMYVPSNLVVTGDAARTVANITASGALFRLSIVSALILQVGSFPWVTWFSGRAMCLESWAFC